MKNQTIEITRYQRISIKKKYVNNERDSFPPLLTHLISLILLSLFLYLIFGDGDRGKSESQFDNFLETLWIELGDSTISVIFITILLYGMVWGCLKMFLDKTELSWNNTDEKYDRYEEDLEKWELNKIQIQESLEKREEESKLRKIRERKGRRRKIEERKSTGRKKKE